MQSERNYSKLEWIFYIIILPILFVSILTITLLWFLDYNVKGNLLVALNKIPGIEKLIDDEQFNNQDYLSINYSKEDLTYTIGELKQTLDQKNSLLTKSEEMILTKDEEIALLNQQIEELKIQLDEKNMSTLSREQEIAELAKIYSNMNPKNSAGILTNLNSEEAVLILGQMNNDSKSKILEKMDQKTAADLSILLKDQKYSKDKDINALQERINTLTSEIDNLKEKQTAKVDYEQLAITYSRMNPAQAAEILVYLYAEDSLKVQNILTYMDPVSRSYILGEMEPSFAAKLTSKMVD